MLRSAALRNFVVGAVFLGSLAIVGVVTLEVTGLPLGETSTVQVRFDQVSGLREGDEVQLSGYRIGQVKKIELLFDVPGQPAPGVLDAARFPIRVTLLLGKTPPLTRDTRFTVKSRGPLGGNYLEIVLGTGDHKAADAEFVGTATPELFDELGDLVRENRATLKEAITQIRDAVRSINEREGALGALVNDPELRDKLARAVENVETFTRAISEGQGTLGKLIMDGKLHDDLQELIASAKRIAADAEEGKGTLGMLLKDEELARRIRDGVQDLSETVAKVNQGEGTVGQLINNREAWDRLVFVLRQVQEGVEDFREQAPINTFVNAIFSAF